MSFDNIFDLTTGVYFYFYISQLTPFMPPPETLKKYNRESAYDVPGSYWCIRLTTRAWKNRLYRLPPKKCYHVYITRSAYHYAYARQTQVNWNKETKERRKWWPLGKSVVASRSIGLSTRPSSLKLLFFGNTTYCLDTASSRYLRNGPAFL